MELNRSTCEKLVQAIDIIGQNFRLVGNCLHAKNEYAENG